MRLVAFFACLFCIFASLSQFVDGADGCDICGRNVSKRSIDLIDVLKVPTYRLPIDLRPVNYELEIRPDIANAKFEGEVNISIISSTSTGFIGLNAHQDLEIRDIKIRRLGVEDQASQVDVSAWKFNNPRSQCMILLTQIIQANESYLINIKYAGNITTNDTSGFFRRQLVSSSGVVHNFLATQLRPQNAQRWFPSMDQPEFKATFELRVARPKTMTTRSNTPIKMSVEMPGDPSYVIDYFEKTPEMSTYQLALMISDFESIAPTIPVDEMENRKLEIRVWGRTEYLDSLAHVPNKVVRIVNYLQKYFNKSIGLPKLDLVAMPLYTATKASDGWGLMFFRESELSSNQIWTTAYELIYQWIGQRITPYRWTDAHVNKALNSFLASKTTVDIEPDEMEGKWPMTMLYSLYYEFGKSFPFSRVAGIRDEATSAKTELVFRMFNYTLGQDLFQKGIQRFVDVTVDQTKSDNQEPHTSQRIFLANDVFKCLDDVVNETNYDLLDNLTIQSIVAHWINRDRVPVVSASRNYESGEIIFAQTVYLREPPPPSNSKMFYQWDIPLVIITEDTLNTSEYRPHTWMKKTASPVMIIDDVADSDKFIIVNPEEIGMFPVNYDSTNWKMLSTFLQGPKRETIPVLTRAKLVHDSWNLAYGGHLRFDVALNMTLFLKNERSHVVWEPVFTMIDHVGRRIEGSYVHKKFETYICSLLRPLYTELGKTAQAGEPMWKVHMRGLVKNFLCRAGYEPCVTEAREQYKKWMIDDEPDKGNPVANEFICPVFRWGTQEEWEFGLQRVMNFPQNTLERKQYERTYLLKTLAGCPRDKYKVERLLNVTILNHYVNFTDSDIRLIYSMLTGGAIGHSTLFNFLTDHWQLVKTRFENKTHLWNGIVNSATSSFNTQEGYDMVTKLYELRKGESEIEDAVLSKALQNIETETKWNGAHLPVIDEWLNAHLTEEDLLASIESTSQTISTTTDTSSFVTEYSGNQTNRTQPEEKIESEPR